MYLPGYMGYLIPTLTSTFVLGVGIRYRRCSAMKGDGKPEVAASSERLWRIFVKPAL